VRHYLLQLAHFARCFSRVIA